MVKTFLSFILTIDYLWFFPWFINICFLILLSFFLRSIFNLSSMCLLSNIITFVCMLLLLLPLFLLYRVEVLLLIFSIFVLPPTWLYDINVIFKQTLLSRTCVPGLFSTSVLLRQIFVLINVKLRTVHFYRLQCLW